MSNTRDIIAAIRASVDAGEAVIERTHLDFSLTRARGPELSYVPAPPRPSVFANDPPPSPALPLAIQHAKGLWWCGCRPIAVELIVTHLYRRVCEFKRAGELPPDESSWAAFVAKHLPEIGVARASAMVERVTRQPVEADTGPMPARDRAAAAILADPAKSNRRIAKEIQVDEGTVRFVRKKLRESAPESAPEAR